MEAPFPVAVHKMWQEKLEFQFMRDGMTEIAPISVNTVQNGTKMGSAGKAVPDTLSEIVDIGSGRQVLSPGETGEIELKGPHMMLEYEGNAEETETTIRDGLFILVILEC